MLYKTLRELFYTQEKQKYQKIYYERFSSPFAIHIPLDIKQYNHNQAFKAFYCYSEEIVLLFEKIHERHKDLLELIYDTPMPVLHQFELSCVVDEVHATSAIEGIHSTHRELKDILDGKTDSSHFSSIIQKYNMLRSGEILFFQT